MNNIVNRETFLRVLRELQKVKHLLRNIRYGQLRSQSIEIIQVGLRQGDPLFSLLFFWWQTILII